jgi:hypothetical protein
MERTSIKVIASRDETTTVFHVMEGAGGELLARLRSIYGAALARISYLDDEGDRVTVSEDIEACEALRLGGENGRELHLRIELEACRSHRGAGMAPAKMTYDITISVDPASLAELEKGCEFFDREELAATLFFSQGDIELAKSFVGVLETIMKADDVEGTEEDADEGTDEDSAEEEDADEGTDEEDADEGTEEDADEGTEEDAGPASPVRAPPPLRKTRPDPYDAMRVGIASGYCDEIENAIVSPQLGPSRYAMCYRDFLGF